MNAAHSHAFIAHSTLYLLLFSYFYLKTLIKTSKPGNSVPGGSTNNLVHTANYSKTSSKK